MVGKKLVKHNLPYNGTPEVPRGWDLYDRSCLPGEHYFYYKDPETDLLSPAPPHITEPDRLHLLYSTPQRSSDYLWQREHRDNQYFGNNEPSPFTDEIIYEVLNERDEYVDYHPWVEANCFQPFARQRGLFWHWVRFKSIITASRLDTILYNGYYQDTETDRLNVILARHHLFKILTCQIPQETFDDEAKVSYNIDGDHLWRGVFGEDYIKKVLPFRSNRHPIILNVGSIPIPGYRWIRVSLDGVDAELGINYEMKCPRPLLNFLKNYTVTAEDFAEIQIFQRSLKKKFVFTNPALEQFRVEIDFMILNELRNPINRLTYEELAAKVNCFAFEDVEPFASFGRQQEEFAPNGYHWSEEKCTRDLGFYFYQTNVQNEIGLDATELVKWDCLAGTLKAVRIKKRNIMFDVAVELQKFWDQVNNYRVEHQITFKDFYRVNEESLKKLGELY